LWHALCAFKYIHALPVCAVPVVVEHKRLNLRYGQLLDGTGTVAYTLTQNITERYDFEEIKTLERSDK